MNSEMVAKPFSHLLVENLKALNAKERDHLMRFAYLGKTSPYNEVVNRWLSNEMTTALRTKTGLPDTKDTACVFASMDYHLDWVHTALTLSCRGLTVSGAVQGKTPYPCDPLATCSDEDDATLRPVSGRQEDVDLAVVFTNGENTVLLFIEAKGVASVDPDQLARKLIRIDRILESSGALEAGHQLHCKFVLIAPEQPKEWPESVLLIASKSRSLGLLMEKHADGIGKGDMNFVELKGFPPRQSLGKVTRIPVPDKPGKYKDWKVVKR